jgi:hypothetical protein
VIRIAITLAAYAAIRDPPPAGSCPYAPQEAAGGGFLIWVPNDTVDELEALRGPCEGDVIVRLAAAEPSSASPSCRPTMTPSPPRWR